MSCYPTPIGSKVLRTIPTLRPAPIGRSWPSPTTKRTRPEQVGNRLLLAGFRRADGYAGLVPARQLDYRDPDALRVAGVGYRAEEQDAGYSNRIVWLPVADPLPPIRLVTRAIVDYGGALPPEAADADAALVDVASTFLGSHLADKIYPLGEIPPTWTWGRSD